MLLLENHESINRSVAIKQLIVDLDKKVLACARALAGDSGDVHYSRHVAYAFRKLAEHCELSANAYARDYHAKLLREYVRRKVGVPPKTSRYRLNKAPPLKAVEG
jgi:hypothetical protein